MGSKTIEGEKTLIGFMIPLSIDKKWYADKSGMIVHARCEFDLKNNSICTVDEYFEKNVKASVPTSLEELSYESIFKIHNSILEQAEKLMVN